MSKPGLPIASHRQQLVDAIMQSDAVVVVGETGSGTAVTTISAKFITPHSITFFLGACDCEELVHTCILIGCIFDDAPSHA